MEALRRKCIKELRPAWKLWSHDYPITEEDAKLYILASGVQKVVVGDSCILDSFLKKSRGSAPVPTYNFETVLDLTLHISSAFCEAVSDHCIVEQNRLEVSRPPTWHSNFSQPT